MPNCDGHEKDRRSRRRETILSVCVRSLRGRWAAMAMDPTYDRWLAKARRRGCLLSKEYQLGDAWKRRCLGRHLGFSGHCSRPDVR